MPVNVSIRKRELLKKIKYWLGIGLLVFSLVSPLIGFFIGIFIQDSVLKTTVIGLFLLGIPEIFDPLQYFRTLG